MRWAVAAVIFGELYVPGSACSSIGPDSSSGDMFRKWRQGLVVICEGSFYV